MLITVFNKYISNMDSSKPNKLFIYACFICFSVVAILMSRPGFTLWYLVWIGFVPVFLISYKMTPKQAFITMTTFATIVCFFNFFWIESLARNFMGMLFPFNLFVVFSYSFYIAIGFGIAYMINHFIIKYTNLPFYFVFPICLITLLEYYPQIFYFGFAETQIPFPLILQGLDISGPLGLDFIILLVNGLLFEIIIGRWKKHLKSFLFGWLIVAVWISYSINQYNYWLETESSWEKTNIGFVQPNNEASFRSDRKNQRSAEFPWELEKSIELANNGAEYIFWPEGNFYFFNRDSVKKSFQDTANKYNFNLFFTDIEYINSTQGNSYYNTIYWINDKGKIGPKYHKNILIPFGEYLPGGKIAESITNYLKISNSNFSPGNMNLVFNSENLDLIPIICYESLFSIFVSKQVIKSENKKLLFVLSQDGWYDSIFPTTEHSFTTTLRSVENRIPIVHIIQNGFSSISTPSGKITHISNYNQREAKNVTTLIAPKDIKTFYSKYPYITKILITCLFILFSISAILKYKMEQRKK